jgi:DNA-binding GntR family transcriptional regulator
LKLRLAPGSRLRAKDLASEYGIGLVPIREALTELSGAGLVTFERQRGFRVAPVSPQDFVDIANTRIALETMAFGQAVEKSSEAWRANLRTAKAAYDEVTERAGDSTPISGLWEDRHRSYTEALIAGCESPTLIRFCLHLHDRFDRYRRLTIPAVGDLAAAALDEDDIFNAAMSGQAEKAMHILRRHIASLADLISLRLAPNPVKFASAIAPHDSRVQPIN